MLLRAIRPFAAHPRVGLITVGLPEECISRPPVWLAELPVERLRLVAGGATRTETVLNALRTIPASITTVLVHDAARPFVTPETITAVIERAAGGVPAVAAVPLADTLKRASTEGFRVVETVPRAGLWRAQTPQGFPRHILERAYEDWQAAGRPDATDDAALLEAAGFPVELVPDATTNIKVTSAADFTLAEALAGR